MQTTAEILKYVEGKYPYQKGIMIKNTSDVDIESQFIPVNQFVIGVTQSDPLEAGINHYKYNMESRLRKYGVGSECIGTSFTSEEIEKAKIVLKELLVYYDLEMNVDKVFEQAHITNKVNRYYFIVITAIVSAIMCEK